MVKVMRLSFWPPPGSGQEPVTTVMRECDLIASVEEVRQQQLLAPGPFFLSSEVFEMDVDDTEEGLFRATMEATERAAKRYEREKHMAILFYFDGDYLKMVSEGGMLSATEPAPLSTEEIEEVFVQLARHPDYRLQHVLCLSEDGRLVKMHVGEVLVEEL